MYTYASLKSLKTIEWSFNSRGLSVGSSSTVKFYWLLGTFCWDFFHCEILLVVLHTMSVVSFHLWRMLGFSVWIWMKSGLFWFIEGQTRFSTSWHAKMSLILMHQYIMFSIQTSTLPFKHAPKTCRCMQTNQLSTESHVEFEDNLNICTCMEFYQGESLANFRVDLWGNSVDLMVPRDNGERRHQVLLHIMGHHVKEMLLAAVRLMLIY